VKPAARRSFFEHQAAARRASRILVALFLVTSLAVGFAVGVVASGVYLAVQLLRGAEQAPAVSWELVGWSTAVVFALLAVEAAARNWTLRKGGSVLAILAGGESIERDSSKGREKRLLNIVDEMSIASGVAVPRVFVMRRQHGINAFAAGHGPNDAVIAVTRGALERLTRDELQGVVAHEFSHILHGDARLNLHMVSLLTGIAMIAEVGESLMEQGRPEWDAERQRTRGDGNPYLAALGGTLYAIGYVGAFCARLVKAALSRQREFLADASALQFTRNADGVAGALAIAAADREGSRIHGGFAESLSHMFFAPAMEVWLPGLLATHPPLEERLGRIDPAFSAAAYRVRRRSQEARAAEEQDLKDWERWGRRPGQKEIVGEKERKAAAAGIAAVVASVGNPGAQHVDYARKLLAYLPAPVREKLATPAGAVEVVLAMVLDNEESVRVKQVDLLERQGSLELSRSAAALRPHVKDLHRAYRLPILALAAPALRELPGDAREEFLAHLERLMQVDGRVTLQEFLLATVVRSVLRGGAQGEARTRDLRALERETVTLLTLLAHASGGDAAAAFAKGAAELGLREARPLAPEALSIGAVGEALEQLRGLAPLAKPDLFRGLLAVVNADGALRLAEAELMRTISIALDCPVPPVLDAVDPRTLR